MRLSFLDVDQFSIEVAEGNTDLEYSDEDVKSSCTFVLSIQISTIHTFFSSPFFFFFFLFCTVLQVFKLNPTSHPSRSRRIHRIYNHRSIQCFHRGSSWTRKVQRRHRAEVLRDSRRQHLNRNIHLISHPQTRRARGKTTHPLRPRLRKKSRHHGGYRRDRLRSRREDIQAAR